MVGNASDREPRRLVYTLCAACGLVLSTHSGTMHAQAEDAAAATRSAERPVPLPEVWRRARDEQALRGLVAQGDSGRGATGDVAEEGSAGGSVIDRFLGVMPWRLPPIRWGGTLTTELRYLDVSSARSLQLVETSSLRASSYVWQPWFAHVNAGINLLTTQERHFDAVPPDEERVKSTAVGGNGSLALFPSSRFPFNAYFDRSDSRSTSEVTLNDYTTTRMGARQSYQPIDGRSTYTAQYDRSVIDSESFGRDVVNAISGTASHQLGFQTFQLAAQRTTNQRERGDGSTLKRITGTHSYRPDTNISVETLANWSSDNFRLTTGPAQLSTDSRFMQLNTFGTWRPDPEEWPVYVTAGLRYFNSEIATNGIPSEAQVISGNVAANYRWRPDTNFFASLSATHAVDDLLTSQTVGVTYTPNPIMLGPYTYTWNTSLALSNQTSDTVGTRQNVAGQATHTVARSFPMGETAQLSLSGSQGYTSSVDTGGVTQTVNDTFSVTQSISHTANAALRFTPGPNSTGFLSVLAADSRSSGTHDSTFQLVNVQLTGQMQFNRYSLAAANLTFQGSRQSTSTSPDTGFTFNTSGSLSYQHARVFGVPRLRYNATYTAYDTRFAGRLEGDFNAPREQVSQSFEQRLDYNIGRIEMRLSTRFAVIEGQRAALVYFRLVRQFGAF